MKKHLIALVCFVFAGVAARAQLVVTPKLGATFSTMNISNGNTLNGGDLQSKTGLAIGVAFGIPLSDALSVQPELLFIQKGYREAGGGSTANFGLNYLEVPLLLRYRIGEADELHFFGYAGPYVGFGLGGNLKAKSGSISFDGKLKFGEEPDNYNGNDFYLGGSDDVNRLDLGLNIGAGVGLPVGPGAVTLEARYGAGFMNLFKPGQGQSASDVRSQHRVFGIFVGYALTLGE